MAEWALTPGNVTNRREVARQYGGALFGGIQPSATTPNIMVYSDLSAGETHDYRFDGWGPDGAYYYTGEGQVGDQQVTKGNKAIVDSTRRGHVLRVFEATSEKQQSGGKAQRYLGAFHVDPVRPYRVEKVTRNGATRKVLVFRLLPDDAVPDERRITATPARREPTSELVSTESNVVKEFDTKARAKGVAHRAEADLMAAWEAHLRGLGHDVVRVKVTIPDEDKILLSDTFDATTRELYEVKPSALRADVRMAIGQLLDYGRHVEPIGSNLVLPVAPSADLLEFIGSLGLGLVVRTGNNWQRMIEPAQE